MKRITALLLTISIAVLYWIAGITVSAAAEYDPGAALNIFRGLKFKEITSSYVVYDSLYGQILADNNANAKLPAGDLMKLMTAYIAYDSIALGKLTEQEKITASATAAKAPGYTAFLSAGDTITVNQALYAMIISSCNDVTVALAEHIAGSEDAFVQLMNQYAGTLGMTDTNFADCTGLSEQGLTTAQDMAVLSNAIVTKYPQYLNLSKIRYDDKNFLRNGRDRFDLKNTNEFVRFVPVDEKKGGLNGSDGLKVNVKNNNYCIAANYKQSENGVVRVLITVILGAESENRLYAEARRTLEYCYVNYSQETIEVDGTVVVTDLKVKKGVEDTVACRISGEFVGMMTAEEKQKIRKETELPETIEAPVQEGDKVGTVKYYIEDEVIYELDIVATADVERAGWFRLFIEWLLEWFGFI